MTVLRISKLGYKCISLLIYKCVWNIVDTIISLQEFKHILLKIQTFISIYKQAKATIKKYVNEFGYGMKYRRIRMYV